MFFFRKILKRQIDCYQVSNLQEFFKVGFHCTAFHHCYSAMQYAMTNISEEERQAQQLSYWCHLCRETISSSSTLLFCPHCHSLLLLLEEEETESPTINTYPNLFSNPKEEEEAEEEEVVEDNNSTCRRQYTCFHCNVTISLISSSSSPLLLCPHCHAEFWEALEPLSPSPSTSSNPIVNSTPHIDDVPEEDEDRYGNSSTVTVTEKKKKSGRRVIFHKIRTFFGFAI